MAWREMTGEDEFPKVFKLYDPLTLPKDGAYDGVH